MEAWVLICGLATFASAAAAPQDGSCAKLVQKVLPPDLAQGDRFGWSIAVEGDTVVIGSKLDDDNGTDSGSAYVYARDLSGVWSQQAKLLPVDGMAGDAFGRSVSISGDTLVVGASADDGSGVDQGSAYVYVRNGATWAQQVKLQPAAASYANIGCSVSIEGEVLSVGASGINKVLMYERSGAAWSLGQVLVQSDPPPPPNLDSFGWEVSLSGDWLIVGAEDDDMSMGSVYFFERNGAIWQERQKILGPNGAKDDSFGYSVSLDGDTAVVGAYGENSNTGAMYAYNYDGSGWIQEARLVGSQSDETFGWTVFLKDGRCIAGAPAYDIASSAGAGASYVFSKGVSGWSLDSVLFNDSPVFGDNFGYSVCIDGDTVAIGAVRDNAPFTDSGSAYLFEVSPAPQPYCTAKVNSCGSTPTIGSNGSPSATATNGFNVHADHTPAGKAGLLLYTDSGPGNSPFLGGILCLAPGNVKRSIAVLDTVGTSGCDGVLSIDMSAFAHGLLGGNPLPSLLIPGTIINCQFWGRDTPGNSLLSDALEYRVCE